MILLSNLITWGKIFIPYKCAVGKSAEKDKSNSRCLKGMRTNRVRFSFLRYSVSSCKIFLSSLQGMRNPFK